MYILALIIIEWTGVMMAGTAVAAGPLSPSAAVWVISMYGAMPLKNILQQQRR